MEGGGGDGEGRGVVKATIEWLKKIQRHAITCPPVFCLSEKLSMCLSEQMSVCLSGQMSICLSNCLTFSLPV